METDQSQQAFDKRDNSWCYCDACTSVSRLGGVKDAMMDLSMCMDCYWLSFCVRACVRAWFYWVGVCMIEWGTELSQFRIGDWVSDRVSERVCVCVCVCELESECSLQRPSGEIKCESHRSSNVTELSGNSSTKYNNTVKPVLPTTSV